MGKSSVTLTASDWPVQWWLAASPQTLVHLLGVRTSVWISTNILVSSQLGRIDTVEVKSGLRKWMDTQLMWKNEGSSASKALLHLCSAE